MPNGEQIVALFKSLGTIYMPECYTHAPIISGISGPAPMKSTALPTGNPGSATGLVNINNNEA